MKRTLNILKVFAVTGVLLMAALGLLVLSTAEATTGTITNDDYLAYLPIVVRPCSPLFADNFEDPASGWWTGDNGDVRWEYIGGEYRILLRNADWWAGVTAPGFTASNYVASVDVRNGSGSFSSFGLPFGISSDWLQFYLFEIFTDSTFALWKRNDGDWTLLASGSSSHIRTGAATNTLRILRDGSLIRAYVNGHQLADVTDGSYTDSRYLGLTAWAYDEPNVDAYFDNFVVYSTSCHPYMISLDTAETTSPGALGEQALSAREQDAGRWRMEMMAPAP